MDGVLSLLARTDAVGVAVGGLLLAMSVTSWTLILWKAIQVLTVARGLGPAAAALWSAPDMAAGRACLRGQVGAAMRPLVDAATSPVTPGLASATDPGDRLTRHLREALATEVERLQAGQVVLASIGGTAPFVGLFGTVWGVQRALEAVGGTADGALPTLDLIAGPVGEALIMTAAGLAVAVPAVLGYNVFGRWIGRCEATLEGFAHDMRAWALSSAVRD